MHSMQRKFGRLLNKNPGDNAKVSVLLNDYEDADRVLTKVMGTCLPSRPSVVGNANALWSR